MELTTYLDGIFSQTDPNAAPGLKAYNDGSLGSATTAFRDGMFSQAAPMAYPGSLLTAYSDGSLGATSKALSPQSCMNWCMAVRSRTARRRCVSACNLAARGKTSMRGLGAVSNTTLIGGALALGVIGLAFVAMKKGKRR
jgi:hypothetical protein